MTSNTNLLDPLAFNTADALNYCKRYVCANCLNNSVLQLVIFTSNKFNIQCTHCKQFIREGDAIRKEEVGKIEHNRAVGEQQMRDDEPRLSTKQCLEDLGF